MIYVGITGLFLTVVGLIAGYLYFRVQRASQRRNHLRVITSTQRLITSADHSLAGALRVSYADREVENPHLLVLTLENLGPKDIVSADFDQQRPIRISVGAAVIGGGNDGPETDNNLSFVASEREVTISPTLLSLRHPHTISLITDGSPSPKMTGAVRDCDLVLKQASDVDRTQVEGWEGVARRAFAVIGSIAAGVGIVTVAVAIFFPTPTPEEEMRQAITETAQRVNEQQERINEQNKQFQDLVDAIDALTPPSVANEVPTQAPPGQP